MKQLFLTAVILLGGCSWLDREYVSGEGYSSTVIGFASDTTAILLKHYWRETERDCGIFTGFGCYGGDYELDIELQLVDIRFQKIYWKSRVRKAYSIAQWTDSTMLMKNDDGYWLWTIGKSELQKANFDWKVEKEIYDGRGGYIISDKFNFRPWKKDSILIFSKDLYSRGHAVIDTKTLTINSWAPVGEYAWTLDCDYFWWNKTKGGLCLVKNENPCGLSLLSEDGYILGSFIYPGECENFKTFSVHYHLIEVSPIKNNHHPATSAMFRYDEKGNIAQEPSFWRYGRTFIDSLGNIVEY